MTVIYEPTRAEQWLYTNLNADGTISAAVSARIYSEVMPQDVTTYPAIVFQFLGAQPTFYGNAATIIWTKLTYLVKAISETPSAKTLQTIIDRVITVLHAQRGGTADAAIDYCIYRKAFRMTTVENNILFQHVGAEFEIAVRAANV